MEYGDLNRRMVDMYRFPEFGYRVRVSTIAWRSGFIVREEFLDDGVYGSLEWDDSVGIFVIKVPEDELKGRKRFTIAHLLGHCALHRVKSKNGFKENVLNRSDIFSEEEERECSAFAYDLIMPRSRVLKALREIDCLKERYDDVAHKALAFAFGVSNLAMVIRLGHQA